MQEDVNRMRVMLLEGTYTEATLPDYEPYREPVITTISLEEPLRKVGDVADYIDYKTALGSHLVTERALTGNESWTREKSYCSGEKP